MKLNRKKFGVVFNYVVLILVSCTYHCFAKTKKTGKPNKYWSLRAERSNLKQVALHEQIASLRLPVGRQVRNDCLYGRSG